MSHRSVRLFIEDTAKSLADDIEFYYARTSDFNVIRDKKGTMITLDLLRSSPEFATDGTQNYMKSWNCSMAFYEFDKKGSSPEEKAVILDKVDLYVDQFINKLNTYSYKSDQVLIEGISQTAFVEATADILTGHLLSFVVVAQDDFDYCAIDCEVTTDECGDN